MLVNEHISNIFGTKPESLLSHYCWAVLCCAVPVQVRFINSNVQGNGVK
jgi:hypothetical protein